MEMQIYISVMFLGFPNEIQEGKPSFLDFENNWLRTDGRTDGPTDGPTDRRTDRPSYRDARTHLKRYMLITLCLEKKVFIFVFEISQSCRNAAKTHYYVLISKAFP